MQDGKKCSPITTISFPYDGKSSPEKKLETSEPTSPYQIENLILFPNASDLH